MKNRIVLEDVKTLSYEEMCNRVKAMDKRFGPHASAQELGNRIFDSLSNPEHRTTPEKRV